MNPGNNSELDQGATKMHTGIRPTTKLSFQKGAKRDE